MEPAQQQLDDNIATGFATPPLPSTASEFITALAHFHRAEIARMAGWRDRIDRTSNWAITGVAAMLVRFGFHEYPAAIGGIVIGSVWNFALSSRFVWGRY